MWWNKVFEVCVSNRHTLISMPVLALTVNRHHSTASSRPPELCSPASRHLACPAHHCGAGLGSVLNRDRYVVSAVRSTHDSEETGGRLRPQVRLRRLRLQVRRRVRRQEGQRHLPEEERRVKKEKKERRRETRRKRRKEEKKQ